MKPISVRRLPYLGLALAWLVASIHLGWEHTHGGVHSHHLLNREDLPSVSNWWGLLTMPVLGWLASCAVAHRAAAQPREGAKALAGFAGALLLGAALAGAFATGQEALTSALFLSTLAAGLVLPIYRPEYVFGYVIGMSFVFGAVLPMLVGGVAAALSATAHAVARTVWRLARAQFRA